MHSHSSIQYDDFNIAEQYKNLKAVGNSLGSVVSFTGLVRDYQATMGLPSIDYMQLEHYPKMTEILVDNIINEAALRFNLVAVTVIHRIGKLLPGDQIVFVGVASQQREDGFLSVQFILDYLKTQVTLWKQVSHKERLYWVEANKEDLLKAKNWQHN